MTDEPVVDVAREARLLLRRTRFGTLATVQEGQPFASLVTHATAPDGAVLLLLSDLSEHTRHLKRDGRCSLMVMGAAAGPNAQTAPRLSLTGTAAIVEDAALRARWVALHPYAGFYAGFGDFHLWRIEPGAGLFVGGFARAHRLRREDLMPDPAAASSVLAAEPGIIAHCNADHPDALDVIAVAAGGGQGGWSMVGCDVEGFDLVREETVRRIAWPAPVDGPGGVRTALIYLASAARRAGPTTAGPADVAPL